MISVTRAWLAFASIGAGMIHLALVIGTPPPLAIASALLGVIEVGGGVAVLVRSSGPGRRAGVTAALAVALLAAAVSLGAAAIFAPEPARAGGAALDGLELALLLAAALDVAAALILAGALMARRRAASPLPSYDPAVALTTGRILRSLAAIAVGALLVGAVTTPALAATEAGRRAQPHGSHVMPGMPALPGEHGPTGGHGDH